MAKSHPDHTMLRVRSALIALVFATLVLALFQSNGLVSWSYDLPINPLTEQIVSASETWNEWMNTLGTTEVSESIQDWVQSLKDHEF